MTFEDDGKGIDKKDLHRVFDKFYRCKDKITRKSKGSGLGLSISKGIVEMHGGNIWAEPRKWGGSRFSFSIPNWR